MNLIPLFNFPTKIIFVDDNESLLNTYKTLDLPNIISCYSQPTKALEDINQKIHLDNHEHLLDVYCENDIGEMLIVSNINKLISSKDKYNYIGQVVTDYKMPDLNGVDLCKSITNNYIKKTLLTGEFEPVQVLPACHDEIVNYYIQKGDVNLDQKLFQSVGKNQKKFFLSLTNFIKVNVLSDVKFANLFDKIIKDYNVKEYYLYTKTGSFIFLNDKGYYLFNVYTDEDIDYINQMLGLNELQTELISRQKIPNAEVFLYPDKPIFNDCKKYENYYYNIVEHKIV